eukprot:7250291-Pyramimonas_sp.AAC.1
MEIWDRAFRELQSVQTTLPLWAASLRLPWALEVTVSESSGYGMGVCRRKFLVSVGACIGRLAEK